MQNLDQELADLQQAHAAAAAEARQAQEVVQQVQARQRAAEEEARALEARRHQSEQACANARVALGMAEERRRANAERHQQAQRDHKDRQAEQRQKQEQLAGLQERLRASEQAALTASAGLAQAYLDKENAERESRQHRAEAERLRAERQLVAEQAQTVRQQWQGLREEAHGLELESSNLRHRLDDLVARLREDHDLDLVALYAEYRPPEAPPDAAAAQEEIADLKKKVARLGSVSLDSLQELQELESRAGALQTQHDDLDAARKALDEIIGRINHDSQELFTTTFAAIRGHFQELFRKMFGGGMADVVLEDPTDVLESGVEIVARPPGKELRSLSLLSGGEKTLTAVALLLAIFRSKPSPFCILDEVDAALDEANTGRVAAALRDYLALSQFIVITHHKRTMAVADVLYGVTMQEAGISKRIAVRLEDYPDEEVRKAG
jgi:chromosome segregation protein